MTLEKAFMAAFGRSRDDVDDKVNNNNDGDASDGDNSNNGSTGK